MLSLVARHGGSLGGIGIDGIAGITEYSSEDVPVIPVTISNSSSAHDVALMATFSLSILLTSSANCFILFS